VNVSDVYDYRFIAATAAAAGAFAVVVFITRLRRVSKEFKMKCSGRLGDLIVKLDTRLGSKNNNKSTFSCG
jgi:hypothetical protein